VSDFSGRRRIYLMRHAQVRYFDGVPPEEVLLTDDGRTQAEAAAAALAGVRFDRVVTSGLERTLQTARVVAPYAEPEGRRALREIESGELRGLEPEVVQEMMSTAFRGVVPLGTQFLGGETVGALLDRVLPEVEALLADESWDVLLLVLHGAVNRAILSHAITGERTFLGGFEQSPGCINVLDVDARREWILRSVNHTPYDPAHAGAARATTMEHLWDEYLAAQGRIP
jgi:broad specificity phosphatase PhoE